MTTAVLEYLKVQKNVQDKVDSIDFPAVNWKAVCLFSFFASLVLLIFYVWQINYLTTGYYLINGYEKKLSLISEENKNLQVSFAENSFLGQVSQRAHALNFQKVTSVKYIQIPDNSVGYNYKK